MLNFLNNVKVTKIQNVTLKGNGFQRIHFEYFDSKSKKRKGSFSNNTILGGFVNETYIALTQNDMEAILETA